MATGIEVAGMLIMAVAAPVIVLLGFAIKMFNDNSKKMEENNEKFNRFLAELLDAKKGD